MVGMSRKHYLTAGAALVAAALAFLFYPHANVPASSAAVHAAVGSVSAVSKDQPPKPKPASKATAANQSAKPLPAAYTPLKEAYAELQARANAGDVAAATRLYRDVNICRLFGSLSRGNTHLAEEINGQGDKVDSMDLAQLDNYKVQLDAIDSRKQLTDKLHVLCDGASQSELDGLVPNLQRAAELGEPNARACYLQNGPNMDMRSFARRPEMLDDYRGSVQSLADAGLADGDWKVVDLLRNAYAPDAQSILAGVVGSDPVQYYRYLQLYRLGAEPYRKAELDRELSAAAEKLTPAQQSDAGAWAQATFQRNFQGNTNSTESTVAGWDACSFPYEGG